jgi:membrane associated rhomboid family serine protease
MKSIWFDIKMIFSSPNQGLKKLIVFNIFIFLVLMVGKVTLILAGHEQTFSSFLEHVTLSSKPSIVLDEPWTIFSYFFIHIELFHLLFNMMFLFWFGIILQDFIGPERIVKLFIWGGISGAIAYLLFVNSFSYFISKGPTYLNGASAGVFAIVVAAATIKPTYRIHLFFIGDVQIKYVAAFYIVWSFIETIGTNAGGNIAHLGGAFTGFMYGFYFQFPQKNNVFVKEEKVFSFVKVTQKKVFESPNDSDNQEVVEEELNQILDKISKSGYDSLSKYEKRRLFKASQKND